MQQKAYLTFSTLGLCLIVLSAITNLVECHQTNIDKELLLTYDEKVAFDKVYKKS